MSNFSLNVKINGAEGAVSTIGEIEQALAKTKEELKGLEVGSQAFEEMGKQARQLEEVLTDSFKKFTKFDGNLANITASVGRLGSSIASSFTLATSAISIFGDKSEDVSKAQVKAQQALAIAFAATTIATNAQKLAGDLKTVGDKIQLGLTNLMNAAIGKETAAKAANAVATGTATVAQRALNAAMNANPVILLITAIAALTGAYLAFSDSQEELNLDTIENITLLIEQTNAIRDQRKGVEDLIKQKIELAIFETEDADEKKRLQNLIVKRNKDFIDESIEQDLKFVDESIEIAEKYSKDLIEILNSRLEVQDHQITTLGRKYKQEISQDQDFYQQRLDQQDVFLKIRLKQLVEEQSQREPFIRDAVIENLEIENIYANHYLKLLELEETFLKNAEAVGKADLEGADKALIDNLNAVRANLTESQKLLQKDLIEKAKINIETSKNQTDAEKKANVESKRLLEQKKREYKKAYDDINKIINDTFSNLEDVEDNYYTKIRGLQFKNGLESVEFEKKVEEQKLTAVRTRFIKELNASVLNDTAKKLALDEFEVQYKDSQARLFEFYQIRLDKETAALVAQNKEIKLIFDTLDDEITFGDQNVTNRLGGLAIRRNEIRAKELLNQIELNKLGYNARLRTLEEIKKIEIQNNIDLTRLREDQARAEKIQQLENTKQLYKDKFGVEFFETEKGKLILNKLEENLKKELRVKLAEIEAEGRATELQLDKQLLDQKLALIQEAVDFAVSSANIGIGLLQSISDLSNQIRENELLDLRNANEERLEIINSTYNRELDLQKQSLERGLISQEQYNVAVNKLDNDRVTTTEDIEKDYRAKELKAKEKAFENEKKFRIANAIISGAQGALQAFTSAFATLPPPANVIVGSSLAGLVGVTTGIQVAAIKKQKFDGGGGVITQPQISGAGPIGGGTQQTPGSGGGFTNFNENLLGTPGSGTDDPNNTPQGPQKVYVLESDITDIQRRVSVAEATSTIG